MFELIHELYQFGWTNELVRLTFELIHAWYQVGWEWIVLIHFCVDTIVYQFGWAVNSINSCLCGYNSCINLVAWALLTVWVMSFRITGRLARRACVWMWKRMSGSTVLRVRVRVSGYLARQSWGCVWFTGYLARYSCECVFVNQDTWLGSPEWVWVRVSGYLARQSWGYVIDVNRISGSIFWCECVYWVNQERMLYSDAV